MFVYQLLDNTLNSRRKGSTGNVQRRSGLLERIKAKEGRPKPDTYRPLIQGLGNSSFSITIKAGRDFNHKTAWGTLPPLIEDYRRSAFPLADVQISWINFCFRHTADIRVPA